MSIGETILGERGGFLSENILTGQLYNICLCLCLCFCLFLCLCLFFVFVCFKWTNGREGGFLSGSILAGRLYNQWNNISPPTSFTATLHFVSKVIFRDLDNLLSSFYLPPFAMTVPLCFRSDRPKTGTGALFSFLRAELCFINLLQLCKGISIL